MAISRELQIGKAGEHLVCADLILQGFNAFISDQGLNYDIVVDVNSNFVRVQVKTTGELKNFDRAKNVYRFNIRNGKNPRAIESYDVDHFAFVALDIKEIAYMKAAELHNKKGNIKRTLDFKTRKAKYPGRYNMGTRGKYFEDFKHFKP